eukprot:1158064-Pelagomonas_calceolata.AAC.5
MPLSPAIEHSFKARLAKPLEAGHLAHSLKAWPAKPLEAHATGCSHCNYSYSLHQVRPECRHPTVCPGCRKPTVWPEYRHATVCPGCRKPTVWPECRHQTAVAGPCLKHIASSGSKQARSSAQLTSTSHSKPFSRPRKLPKFLWSLLASSVVFTGLLNCAQDRCARKNKAGMGHTWL